MPVQVSYPGVYVQEVPSGVRTITGVSTSVAAFVGMIQRGRLNVPTRVLSFADYERSFGTDTSASEMTDQVRQFFLNGGREAWITRIANGATFASVSLKEETGAYEVLNITAKEAGPDGNSIRVEVDYNTPQPEKTFNLRIFRPVTNAVGVFQIETDETFPDLSMDPNNRRYVETIVNQQSTLVDVVDVVDPMQLSPGVGYALSGLLFASETDALNGLNEILDGTTNSFQISVDGTPFVTVTLTTPVTFLSNPPPLWSIEGDINDALNFLGKSVTVSWQQPARFNFGYLEIRSSETSGGSVEIQPASTDDAAVALQLGIAQGGIEFGGYAALRPAPSGVVARLISTTPNLDPLWEFVAATATDFGDWTLKENSLAVGDTGTPVFAGSPFYLGTAYDVGAIATNPPVGSLLNVLENLQALTNSINNHSDARSKWQAVLQGYRLVLQPLFGGENPNVGNTTLLSSGTYDLSSQLFNNAANVRSYSLGTTGIGIFQTIGSSGGPGVTPVLSNYSDAFDIIDREVDLFNIMMLPRDTGQIDSDRNNLWGTASAFCQRKRAFLLVDPPSDGGAWSTANDVDSGIAGLRIGVVKDHAAIYWPRVQVPTDAGTLRTIDPSGSIAGVMARTDSNRGVWKAPAGLEAAILGIRGVEHSMSDPENGLINPQAVNAIRVFPNGIVSWGARTMDGFDNSGNNDYKYVPVRRLALFIQESLFRGLKFAVFEPNDEPLWAQIRLAAGAFMNNLFRQGAFQGQKARDAYFVKVDSETTTQNDINLGIVNVVVGFAPLKPAEFVVITLQQMAGQVQT
jgi:phage tail sheath protein FI